MNLFFFFFFFFSYVEKKIMKVFEIKRPSALVFLIHFFLVRVAVQCLRTFVDWDSGSIPNWREGVALARLRGRKGVTEGGE